MVDPAPLSWLLEVYFIGFRLLAEKCKPIIICGAYKTLRLVFPQTHSCLTRVKRRLEPFHQFPILSTYIYCGLHQL